MHGSNLSISLQSVTPSPSVSDSNTLTSNWLRTTQIPSDADNVIVEDPLIVPKVNTTNEESDKDTVTTSGF